MWGHTFTKGIKANLQYIGRCRTMILDESEWQLSYAIHSLLRFHVKKKYIIKDLIFVKIYGSSFHSKFKGKKKGNVIYLGSLVVFQLEKTLPSHLYSPSSSLSSPYQLSQSLCFRAWCVKVIRLSFLLEEFPQLNNYIFFFTLLRWFSHFISWFWFVWSSKQTWKQCNQLVIVLSNITPMDR